MPTGPTQDELDVGMKFVAEGSTIKPTLDDIKHTIDQWAREVGEATQEGFATKDRMEDISKLHRFARDDLKQWAQEARQIAQQDIARLKEEMRAAGGTRKMDLKDQIAQRKEYARMDEDLVREHAAKIAMLKRKTEGLEDLPEGPTSLVDRMGGVAGAARGPLGMGKMLAGAMGFGGVLGAGVFLAQGIAQARELDKELVRVTRRIGDVQKAAYDVGREFAYTRQQMLSLLEAFAEASTYAASMRGKGEGPLEEGVYAATGLARYWGVQPQRMAQTLGRLQYLTGLKADERFLGRLSSHLTETFGPDRARLLAMSTLEEISGMVSEARGMGILTPDPNLAAGYLSQLQRLQKDRHFPFLQGYGANVLSKLNQAIMSSAGPLRASLEAALREQGISEPPVWLEQLGKGIYGEMGPEMLHGALGLISSRYWETNPETGERRRTPGWKGIAAKWFGDRIGSEELGFLIENLEALRPEAVRGFASRAGEDILKELRDTKTQTISQWDRIESSLSEIQSAVGMEIAGTLLPKIVGVMERFTTGPLARILFGPSDEDRRKQVEGMIGRLNTPLGRTQLEAALNAAAGIGVGGELGVAQALMGGAAMKWPSLFAWMAPERAFAPAASMQMIDQLRASWGMVPPGGDIGSWQRIQRLFNGVGEAAGHATTNLLELGVTADPFTEPTQPVNEW